MNKIDLSNVALPAEDFEVDGENYTITALPATKGLEFLERYQEQIDTGKPDLSVMKQIICMSVTKDGKVISDKTSKGALSFDVLFARKLGHMRNLFNQVLEFNFGDVFNEAVGEEEA